MNCPVCQLALPQTMPPFCPQCAWDLRNDLTINTFFSAIPPAEVDTYNLRLDLARQNWMHIQQMKNGQAGFNNHLKGATAQEDPAMSQNNNYPFELQDGDTNSVVNLNDLVREYKLFIDTDSLLETGADKAFQGALLPLLQKHNANILVSGRTIDCLEYQKKSQNPDARSKSEQGLQILRTIQIANRLLDARDPHAIAGDPFDTFNLFTELFIGYQLKFQLCLVTQNEALALQILKNARSPAFNRVRDVKALYIEDGQFKNWIPRIIDQAKSTPDKVTASFVTAGFKIVVDTCSLLLMDYKQESPIGIKFFRNTLLPEIIRHDNKLIVPNRVIMELQKQSRSTEQKKANVANEALSILMDYDKNNRLIVGEDSNEVAGTNTFADPVFLRLCIRFQNTHDICFITQDTNLAKTLLDNHQNGPGHQFLVTFIPQEPHHLVRWESKLANYKPVQSDNPNHTKPKTSSLGNNAQSTPQNANQQSSTCKKKTAEKDNSQKSSEKQQVQPFSLVKQVFTQSNKSIPVSPLPGTGGTVIDSQKKPIQLIEELAEGGEGKIYRTNNDAVVCKIYHEDRITESRRDKLKLMVSRDIGIREVCWPIDVVTNVNGQFVGYLMPKVDGKIMKTAVFAKPLLKKNFSNWTRIQLTQMAITILNAIAGIHRLNIYIGDINPQNILVKDEHTIYIVDTDSFQVEGYPCPVGTETFTPPERQGMNYADFLRTEQDELFAVTTMLFMILFIGKAPYSSQGGGEAAENIRSRTFAYDRDTDERPPIGAWQFIWSHLHPALKHDFLDVFSKGERVSIKEMIRHLNLSLAAMRKGERNTDLFPDKPWQPEGKTVVVKCNSCPPGKSEHTISVRLAEKLQSENRSFRCSQCGALKKLGRLETTREMECTARVSPRCYGRVSVPVDELNRLTAQNKPFVCNACSQEMNYRMVDCALRISPNCAGRSRVSVTHLNNLATQNRAYWCSACQEAEKARRASERSQRRNTKSYSKKSNKSGCFIATATYESDCAPQVLILRAYRDRVLLSTRAGSKFVDFYYQVGPWIASAIHSIPILRPCFRNLFDRISTRIRNRLLMDSSDPKGDNDGR